MLPHDKLNLELAIDQLKAVSPYFVEIYPEIAKLLHAYYLELIHAGFKEQDAIKIVKHQGWSAGLDNGEHKG